MTYLKEFSKNINMTPAVDTMYINKIPFTVTMSRAIHFGTVEMINDERRASIIWQATIGTTYSPGL